MTMTTDDRGNIILFKLGRIFEFHKTPHSYPAWEYGGSIGPLWFYTYLRDMEPKFHYYFSWRGLGGFTPWMYIHLPGRKSIFIQFG